MSHVTPQDQVKIIKHVANVVRWNDMDTLQHELRCAEYEGWHRGFDDATRVYKRNGDRNEVLAFLCGWTLGATLMAFALIK